MCMHKKHETIDIGEGKGCFYHTSPCVSILGMRPFIPEAEDESFDEFLRGVGVSTGNGNNGRGTHSTTYIRHNR